MVSEHGAWQEGQDIQIPSARAVVLLIIELAGPGGVDYHAAHGVPLRPGEAERDGAGVEVACVLHLRDDAVDRFVFGIVDVVALRAVFCLRAALLLMTI